MKRFRLLPLFIFWISSLFGQNSIETKCLDKIDVRTNIIKYPRYNQAVRVSNDTIYYEKGIVVLDNSDADAFILFRNGLMSPLIVLGTSTIGDTTFKESSIPFIGKMNLSSFTRIALKNESDTARIFKFLLWREGFANPMLYLLQIINANASMSTSTEEFIKGATLRKLIFCSVLI